MSKLSNTLTLLQLLQDCKKYSIKELSEILEVSERMIRIYKDELDKSGIYVDSIRGPYGGYVISNKIKIPIRKFSEEDLETLELIINKETNKKTKENLQNISDKIKGIYIKRKQEDDTILDDNFNKKFNLINKALKQNKNLKITYYSFNKGPNERIIEPLELFLFYDGWNLKAYCQKKKAIRHFELKRIIKFEIIN